jgi:hypothetical protein
MRFAAALISTQMLVSAVSAETLPEKLVSILKDVCVAPKSPEAMMAVAERAAATENWTLIRSGPAPMSMMQDGSGAKSSYESRWQVDLPEGAQVSIYISILRPEQPGVKYDICIVAPDKDVDGDDLALAIDRQFGPTLTKDTSGRFRDDRRWFFAEEKAKRNCGKHISFSLNQSHDRGKPKALAFVDFAFLDEWHLAAQSFTRCLN